MDLATISTPRLQDEIQHYIDKIDFLFDGGSTRRNRQQIRGILSLLTKAQGELDRRGAEEAVAV